MQSAYRHRVCSRLHKHGLEIAITCANLWHRAEYFDIYLNTGADDFEIDTPLAVTSKVRIYGRGANASFIDGSHTSRLFDVPVCGTARIWDPSTGQVIETYHVDGSLYAVDWKPDGSAIVYGGEDTTGNPLLQISNVQSRMPSTALT